MLNQLFQDRILVELTGADVWSSIQHLNTCNVPLYHLIQTDDLTAQLEIDRKSAEFVCNTLEKRGDSIRILSHSTPVLFVASILSRPVLVTASILLTAWMLFFSQRILILEVEGNIKIPTNQILEAANSQLSFWQDRRSIRSEQIKNHLLSAIPQLQWAGVNTYGCRAVISVREKGPEKEKTEDPQPVSSIVASCDGIIHSITALQGTLMCSEGDSVRTGQLLVSGYADCGTSIKATHAKGEIYAETVHKQISVFPLKYQKKTIPLHSSLTVSICFGKKRIFLWKGSGIWDARCDRISDECQLTLPGGFLLPISLRIDRLIPFQTIPAMFSPEKPTPDFQNLLQQYLSQQMIAGRIESSEETETTTPEFLKIDGVYHCLEMIGRARFEEIGDLYGKNS